MTAFNRSDLKPSNWALTDIGGGNFKAVNHVTGRKFPSITMAAYNAFLANPIALVPPNHMKVTGNPIVGGVLTAVPDAYYVATGSVTYQWLRDGVPIAAAISASYTLVIGDLNTNISCQVAAALAVSGCFYIAS
jgi:hypothetical protein